MNRTFSLDGSWQVIFDHDNKGRTLNWQHREQFRSYHAIEEVAVPACLEEFRQDYEGTAWYGKSFHLPADWEGKTVRVRFEAVNYRAEVWVNGEAAGAHEGGYTDFELEIGDLLYTDAENFIAVRVITPADHPRCRHRRPGTGRHAPLARRHRRRDLAARFTHRHRCRLY